MCKKIESITNKEEQPYEIAIDDLRNIQDDYIEGYGYEVHPIDTWYAIDFAIKSMQKLKKIEQIIKTHDNDNIPEDYFYIDKIRKVLCDDDELTEELKNEN
jgi:hypothetical protein